MTKTNVTTIEQEIRAAYAALEMPLASKSAFGATSWEANSQYGYTLSVHVTETEAERAALDYYSERMNLIRQ